MRFSWKWLAASVVLCSAIVAAQGAPSTPAEPSKEVSDFVAQQFGPGFSLVSGQPPIEADLDGDGQPDLTVVATGPNPFLNENSMHYKVIDPYDAYFGFGNPKETIHFPGGDYDIKHYLLIAHDWRHTPKAKFVLINVPGFTKLHTGNFLLKKKAVPALTGSEEGGVSWAIFWDGKKYRWEAYAMND